MITIPPFLGRDKKELVMNQDIRKSAWQGRAKEFAAGTGVT